MKYKFEQGDRVKLSKLALDNYLGTKDMIGTVSGRPHQKQDEITRVMFDGYKQKTNFHNSFLKKIKV